MAKRTGKRTKARKRAASRKAASASRAVKSARRPARVSAGPERRRAEQALVQSESNFQALAQNANDGILVNADGRHVFANRRIAEMLGYEVEALIGTTIEDLVHPDEQGAVTQRFRRRLNGAAVPPQYETRFRAKDGTAVPVEITAAVTLWQGKPAGLVVVRDISQRQQVENALRARERQQAAVVELGRHVLAGAEAADLMNLAADLVARNIEVEYAKVLELLPDGRDLLLRAGTGWREGLVGHATVSTDHDSQAGYTLLSHGPVIVEDLGTETRFSGPPLLTEHGVVSGLSVIIHGQERPYGVLGAHTRRRRTFTEDDVNFLQSVAHLLADALERRRVEDKLRIKDIAIASAVNPIILADLRGNLTYANRACLALCGYGNETEVLGLPIARFAQNSKEGQAIIQGLWEKGHWVGEFMARKRDGAGFKAHLSAHLVHDALGRPQCMMASFTDLTEIERSGAQLRESQRALAALMSNLPGMVYRCRNDRDWTLEFASDGCLALTGHRPEDFVSQRVSFAQTIHPEDRDRVWDDVQQALRQTRPFELFYRIVTARGELKHVREQGRGMYAADGALLSLEGFITDITARQTTEEALRTSEERLRLVAENMADGLVTIGENCLIESFNPAAERIFGYRPDEMLGKNVNLLMPEPYCNQHNDYIGNYLASGRSTIFGSARELPGRRKDGTVFPLELIVTEFHHGERRLFAGIVRDISARKVAEEQMRKLSQASEQTADSIMITDREGVIEYVNPAFERITGYTRAEAVGRKPDLLKSGRHDAEFYQRLWDTILGGETFREVLVNRRKDGNFYHEEQTITPLKDGAGRITHFISTGRDISERIETEEHMQYLAHHDALTELPNRILFLDRLQRALVRAQRYQRLVAVMFMDLDGFKEINDAHGHDVGDQLLRALSQRLNECMRQGDTVSRLGGDEFAILVEDIAQPDHALPVAGKVLKAIAMPVVLGGNELRLTTSIGISCYPLDGQDAQILLKNADAAMYRAKERGKNNFQFYSEAAGRTS